MNILDQSETKLLLIGDGLASWGVLYQLSLRYPDLEIIHLADNEKLAPCTLNSTATVAPNGIEKGISPLGDLLFDSYLYTKELIEKWNGEGITKTFHYHIGEKDELERRFKNTETLTESFLNREYEGCRTDAYLFNSQVFYSWFCRTQMCLLKNYSFHKEMAVNIDDQQGVAVKTLSGKEYRGDFAILCTGAWGRHHTGGKAVCGHYLQWDHIQFPASFFITYKKHNLIYNKEISRLMLGGTSNKDEVSLLDSAQIQLMRDYFNQVLVSPLPAIEKAVLKQGIRQKGKKRMPFYGPIEGLDSVYGIHSLYKNGYTLAWELGRRVIDQIES